MDEWVGQGRGRGRELPLYRHMVTNPGALRTAFSGFHGGFTAQSRLMKSLAVGGQSTSSPARQGQLSPPITRVIPLATSPALSHLINVTKDTLPSCLGNPNL